MRKTNNTLPSLNPRAPSQRGNKLAHKVTQILAIALEGKMMLRMGSPAPSIKVEDWLRGEPLADFQPGIVYIVEFWATWCELSAAEMLELMQLQEKYKDSGLEVVGIAADGDAPTAVEARTKLDAWLAEKCPDLNYRIAFDYTGEMKKLWREPSFCVGIATSFVVDRGGCIAFIGHPSQLGEVLPKVLNGSWRTSNTAKVADQERIATSEPLARGQALKKPIDDRFWAAVKLEDWKTALWAIEEGIALMPDGPQFPPSPCTSVASQNTRHVDRLARDAPVGSRRDRQKFRGLDGFGARPTFPSG